MKKKKKKLSNTIKPNNQVVDLPIETLYQEYSNNPEYTIRKENAYRMMNKEFLESQLIQELNNEDNS